jgi:hypothetical protein
VAPGLSAGRHFIPYPRELPVALTYMRGMRKFIWFLPLFGLLAGALWFAGATWFRLSGDAIPLYGWFAIVGGVFFSLVVGGGLMALTFYSSRHGYDDPTRGTDRS